MQILSYVYYHLHLHRPINISQHEHVYNRVVFVSVDLFVDFVSVLFSVFGHYPLLQQFHYSTLLIRMKNLLNLSIVPVQHKSVILKNGSIEIV